MDLRLPRSSLKARMAMTVIDDQRRSHALRDTPANLLRSRIAHRRNLGNRTVFRIARPCRHQRIGHRVRRQPEGKFARTIQPHHALVPAPGHAASAST